MDSLGEEIPRPLLERLQLRSLTPEFRKNLGTWIAFIRKHNNDDIWSDVQAMAPPCFKNKVHVLVVTYVSIFHPKDMWHIIQNNSI